MGPAPLRGEGEKARILRAPRKTGRQQNQPEHNRKKNTKEVRQSAVETAGRWGGTGYGQANRKKGKRKKQEKGTVSQEEYTGGRANGREVGRGNSTVPKAWVIR